MLAISYSKAFEIDVAKLTPRSRSGPYNSVSLPLLGTAKLVMPSEKETEPAHSDSFILSRMNSLGIQENMPE
jgi:hypothetical protein